jgi:hypothetical protein
MTTPDPSVVGEAVRQATGQPRLLPMPERLVITVTPHVDRAFAVHFEATGIFDTEPSHAWGRLRVDGERLVELVIDELRSYTHEQVKIHEA